MGDDVVKPPSKYGGRLLRAQFGRQQNLRNRYECGRFPETQRENEGWRNREINLKRGNYEPVGYAWTFRVFGGEFRDPGGVPVVRTMKQLGEIEK